jgi:ANTAR domain
MISKPTGPWNGWQRSIKDVQQAMRGLAASADPAVVFSSLARSCIPSFSDSCSVELSEGVEPLFRAAFPMAEEASVTAKPESVTASAAAPRNHGNAVSTSFQDASALGFPSYAGVVLHSWDSREPTAEDAIIARLLVDHAVALVHSERLAQCKAQAEERAAKLALELITSRVEGEAIGILITKHKAGREEALRLLRRASRARGRTLYDVAMDVIRTGELGSPLVRSDRRGKRGSLHVAASDGCETARHDRGAQNSGTPERDDGGLETHPGH